MKSGVVAGAVSGIAASVVGVIVANIFILAGYTPEQQDPILVMQWLFFFTGLTVFWGAVWGKIYSKVHDLVPGKGVLKGLYFSLIIWFCFVGVFTVSYLILSFGYHATFGEYMIPLAIMWGISGFFSWITYGAVLGALYKK